MSDKYYTWLAALNQRDNSLLILTIAGVAIGLGWVLLDNLKLPATTKRVCKWGYALSTLGLYVMSIAMGIAYA